MRNAQLKTEAKAESELTEESVSHNTARRLATFGCLCYKMEHVGLSNRLLSYNKQLAQILYMLGQCCLAICHSVCLTVKVHGCVCCGDRGVCAIEMLAILGVLMVSEC